jgi:hypothetical protein
MTCDNGAYSEICYVAVQKLDGTYRQFAAYVELDSIDPKNGDKDGSSANMANGGRIWKKTPQADTEISLKLYEKEIGSAASLKQDFNGTTDASAPLVSTNTHVRDCYRVVFLWTDDPSVTTANGSTASGFYSEREYFDDVRLTSCQTGTEDGTRIVNVTFKGPAFNQAAEGRNTTQSVTSSDGAGLSALGDYESS